MQRHDTFSTDVCQLLNSGRVYAYGYRYREVPLPGLLKDGKLNIKPGSVIGATMGDPDLEVRPIVQVSLGCHAQGIALPHPCPQDVDTMKAGTAKRFAIRTPPVDPELLMKFRRFVKRWIHHNLTPLSPDEDVSIETWLEHCPYPAYRKKELLELFYSVLDPSDPRYYKCKSFMKDETYPTYKHARAINSRHDYFKCRVGPIFKAIEKVVYKHPSFIKHVPVKDRAKYIFDMLFVPGAKYIATDYTAFESLFVKELMEACEFELYDYMTSKLPCHAEFMDLCYGVLAGSNECQFKHFKTTVPATRMSGEMCTSLGNGFSNLMFMLFTLSENGCSDVEGVIEGDDGLFRFRGPVPTEAQFARLGLMIKMEVHDRLETASFCGLVFDLEDKRVVTNPLEVAAAFGWTSRRYARSGNSTLKVLLRAKSLSLAYQYPGCPIIQSLAHYGLRMTRGIQVKRVLEGHGLNMWERDQLSEAVRHGHTWVEVGQRTRLLVEELYGVTLEEQRRIESYLDNLDQIVPLDLSPILHHFHSDVVSYWNDYVRVLNPKDQDLERPISSWPVVYPREW